MRKLLTFIAGTLITGSLIAGGLVTNTNQSAMYTRLQSRNASTAIDAVYYNPAGVTKLGNGLFISVNNQTIRQNKTVINNYTYLNGTPKEYTGKVSAPIFPGVYAALNFGKISVSAGFNPIGGGGGAKYNAGLPSIEMPVSDLVPLLVTQGIPTTQYSADIYFEGSSTYFGYQLNLAYKINDMLSVGAGVRLVSAKNDYKGSLSKISINPNYPGFGAAYNGSMVLASDFFTSGTTVLTGLAAGATGNATLIGTKISGGVPPTTLLGDAANNGLTSTQISQIQQILGAAGQTPAQIAAATMAYAQAVLTGAAPVFTAKATAMSAYAAQTGDMAVDVEQTGMGYSPVLSVNLSPIDQLNIAIKYEFKTKLELTTKVFDNKGGGIFTNGEKVIADMPAMLAAGVEFKPIDRLMVTASANYYFDKNVDYDGSKTENINMIKKNMSEYALGAQLGITDKIRVSAGWLGTFPGVNADYQNDQRFDLKTNSFGGGFGLRIAPMVDLNLGGQYTTYKEESKTFNYMLGSNPVPVKETYDNATWVIAAGIDLHFGK